MQQVGSFGIFAVTFDPQAETVHVGEFQKEAIEKLQGKSDGSDV